MNQDLSTEIVLSDKLVYHPVDEDFTMRAEKLALDSRPELMAQLQREDTARLSANATKAERIPSLALFGDYGTIGSGPNNAIPTRTVGVALKIPIFDGGRRDARRAESSSQHRQEQIRTHELREEIALEVRLSLDSLRSADEQVRVATEGLKLAENELAQAQRRTDAGVASSLEVTDAQTRLARARDNYTAALFLHESARIDLGQATGLLDRFLD
jgi:outer membrane protein TolC